jgi:hypothetical protein
MINVPTEQDFNELKAEIQALHKKVDYLIKVFDQLYQYKEYKQKEAAARLGISVSKLEKLRYAGRIAYLPNPIRFTEAHLEEYRKSIRVPARKSPFL